ncbi:MAG: hypothetical protein R3258_07265 [Acidimicrobiia bacterium]|nr:hypothetical protein [Acidimicrobiia bacterium]
MSRLEDQIRRFAQVMDSLAPSAEDLMPPELAEELDVAQRPGIEVRIPLGGPPRRRRRQFPRWAWGLVGAIAAAAVAVPLLFSIQADEPPVATQPSTSTTLAAEFDHELVMNLPDQMLAGYGWAPNSELTVTIVGLLRRPGTPTGGPYVAMTNEAGEFEIGPIVECCDIAIEVSDGITTRTVDVIWYLQLLRVDPVTDMIAGAVEEPADVHVRVTGGPEEYETSVSAGSNGRWLVELAGVFDLLPGMIVHASVATDNFTYTVRDGFYVENNVDVWLSQGPTMSGWGFLPRGLIDITVDGVPLPDQVVAGVAGDFDVDLASYGITLPPGTTIVVSDGVDEHTMVVPVLTFDTLNVTAGTAAGTSNAPDGTTLQFGLAIGLPGDPDELHPQYEVLVSGGVWNANFDPLPPGWEIRDVWIMYEPQDSPFYVHFPLS